VVHGGQKEGHESMSKKFKIAKPTDMTIVERFLMVSVIL
jgi:hypothetical protein